MVAGGSVPIEGRHGGRKLMKPLYPVGKVAAEFGEGDGEGGKR